MPKALIVHTKDKIPAFHELRLNTLNLSRYLSRTKETIVPGFVFTCEKYTHRFLYCKDKCDVRETPFKWANEWNFESEMKSTRFGDLSLKLGNMCYCVKFKTWTSLFLKCDYFCKFGKYLHKMNGGGKLAVPK